MILRCIKTFHSKRDNSHWCQNSNQRKFLEHSCLIITVSLPTLFLLTHHFLSPSLSLPLSSHSFFSLSLTLSPPLSFSLLLSYWCQISNLLKFLDNHLWTWLFSLPTFYLFSFPLFILTLSLPTFSLFSHFLSLLPILSSQLFHPTLSSLSFHSTFSLLSSLSPHSNTYLSPHPYFLTIIPLSYPCLSHQSLRPPLSFFLHPSLTPLYLLPLSPHLNPLSTHSLTPSLSSFSTLSHPYLSQPSPPTLTPLSFSHNLLSLLTPISLTTLSPSFLKPLPIP